MKLFHISDLHIGKQLHGYSLIEDQREILNEILRLITEYHPQALLIAGDVYDRAVPSAEAVEVLDEFLTRLSRLTWLETFIISGNHDNDRRLDFGGRILKNCHIHISSIAPDEQNPTIAKEVLMDEHGTVSIYLMPFLKPSYVKSLYPENNIETYEDAVGAVLEHAGINKNERNVLVAHQLFSGHGQDVEESASESFRVGGQDNIDVRILQDRFDYAAFGHLHAPQKAGKTCYRYSGSPLKYSISEEHQKKGISVVTLGKKGEVETSVLPLIPKREVRSVRGTLTEICQEASGKGCEDYVAVTLTDEEELYDAGHVLKQVYPNLLFWQVDNSRTRHEIHEIEEIVTLDAPIEAFAAFYEEMQGIPLSQEEETRIARIIEKAGERL